MDVGVVPVQGYNVRPKHRCYVQKMILLKNHSLLRVDENRAKERGKIHECWVPVWLVLPVKMILSVFRVLVGEVVVNAALDERREGGDCVR